MKMKFVRNVHTKRREMLVASQRGETLDTKSADKLADDPSALLLGFAYEKQRGSGTVILHYDVEGLWSLKTYLSKRALSSDELMGLLEATERVLDICAEVRLKPEGLLFDPEYVFVDAQCCPRFALVVLEDVPFQARNSPLMLLRAMTAEHVRYATPDATGLAQRVRELVVDLGDVFSANKFRRLMEDERRQSDSTTPDARHSVVEPGTGSVWATAGGGTQNASPVDGGSLFWSPLAGMAAEPAEQPQAKDATGLAEPKQPEATPAAVVQRVPEQPEVAAGPVAPQQPKVAAPAVVQRAPEPTASAADPVVAPSGHAPSMRPQVETPTQGAGGAEAAASTSVPQPAPNPVAANGVCLVRPATGERFPLPLGQQVQVGRGSGCAIRLLGNRKLSRVHAALTSTGQMVMVSDVGAVNGVFVEGQRLGSLQSTLVTAGQHIRLADEDFLVTTS